MKFSDYPQLQERLKDAAARVKNGDPSAFLEIDAVTGILVGYKVCVPRTTARPEFLPRAALVPTA